jgi:hypothetical protein
MTTHEHDEPTADALNALLHAGAPRVPDARASRLREQILDRAMLPLAARRRSARKSAEETLATWVRYIVPAATAAALIAVLSIAQGDASSDTVASTDGHVSDPTALFQALNDDSSQALGWHLTASDDATSLTAADAP